jgi:anaerobic selenocysteine-containing dehydrogenase
VIEPTVEQIEAQFAEAVFVLSTTRLEDGPAYWALHRRIATALARRALEARDEALEKAADIARLAIRALRDGAR